MGKEELGIEAVPEDLPQGRSARPAFPPRPLAAGRQACPTCPPGAPRTWPPAPPTQPCCVCVCLPCPPLELGSFCPKSHLGSPISQHGVQASQSEDLQPLQVLTGCFPLLPPLPLLPLERPPSSRLPQSSRGAGTVSHLLSLTSEAQCHVCWRYLATC